MLEADIKSLEKKIRPLESLTPNNYNEQSVGVKSYVPVAAQKLGHYKAIEADQYCKSCGRNKKKTKIKDCIKQKISVLPCLNCH